MDIGRATALLKKGGMVVIYDGDEREGGGTADQAGHSAVHVRDCRTAAAREQTARYFTKNRRSRSG